MEDAKIYTNKTHPADLATLERLTQPKNWDYSQFRRVLIALGIVSNGQSIPAVNRPETIHLQGWRSYIDDLLTRTNVAGREHARVIFVDTERKSLVMSGKIAVGTREFVALDTTKEPGREEFQKFVASIHIHPSGLASHGLSGQDYQVLLLNQSKQVMIIGYGESNLIMVLKTSATPNNLSQKRVNRQIKDCEDDYLNNSNGNMFLNVIEFNKAICSELGLTLYIADKNSRDLFKRVEVTK